MPFPYDEDKLPDTDWTQKPIVIVVGNPPNTERYSLLHRFLAEKVEANEIEVCWMEQGEYSDRVFVAPRNGIGNDGYQSHLYRTLNFDFLEEGNLGFQRLIFDPDLSELRETTANRPPVFVVSTVIAAPIEFPLAKFKYPEIFSFKGLRNKTTRRKIPEEFGFKPLYGLESIFGLSHVRNVFSKYEDLATKLKSGSFSTLLAVDELWYSSIADYVTSMASYRPFNFEVVSADEVYCEAIRLPEERHLLQSLNFYFTSEGTYKEHEYWTATRELQRLYLDFLRKFSNPCLPVDEIDDELDAIDNREIFDFHEMNSYIEMLDSLLSFARSAEGEAPSILSKAEQERDELIVQAAIARKELVETLAATVQERTRNELALSALDEQARSLHIHLSQAIKEADGFIAKCSELIHEIVLYQDTPYIEGLNKRQKKKAFDAQGKRIKAGKSFISENEVKLLEIAAAIRSRPDEALSLYNATIYFVATKLLRTTKNDDRLLKVSARQIKDAVCLSYANAGKDERNWFKGLESLASDDTAKDLYALLIEGVSDPYEDHKMTFSDLSTFLEQIIDNDARLSAVSTRAETMYAFANGIVDTPTLDAVAMVANRDVVDAEVIEDSFDPQPSGPTL